MFLRTAFFLLSLTVLPAFAAGGDVALITSLTGSVSRVTEQGAQPVQSFVKLKQGDQLSLDKSARLQVVYFDSGRQETWNGAGKLEIAASESKSQGMAAPEVKTLPAVMVKQIARTPALDTQGRGGVTRLRAIPTPEAIAKVESNYRKMRDESDKTDINPELYLLSGMFELRQLERVEQVLNELKQAQPANAEVAVVAVLYQKAVKNAREAMPAKN